MSAMSARKMIPSWLLALLLPQMVAAFGNEYVHIKVHVPKEHVPSIAVEPEPIHPQPKVIHHFHHHAPPHQRSRGRAPSKLQASPLLESVILSDLDKPLHMSEHAEYLNHAKELAEHLSEAYAIKKPPPPPPKKKVNTYTIIEEKHRSNGYEYESQPEHGVDTYRVIENRPQHPQHTHPVHQQPDEDDDDVGYHYSAPVRQHRHKSSSASAAYHVGVGGYPEPAPVEEPLDFDSYLPPSYGNVKSSARSPAHTLEAPGESSLGHTYSYDFGGSGSSSNSFRPSPQLPTDAYEDEIDAYAAPIPSRRRRPAPVDWPSHTGYNTETHSGIDSYHVGHVQGTTNSGYQYSGPYL